MITIRARCSAVNCSNQKSQKLRGIGAFISINCTPSTYLINLKKIHAFDLNLNFKNLRELIRLHVPSMNAELLEQYWLLWQLQ
jgi:hypothetical protein